jgi:hypothetical protein
LLDAVRLERMGVPTVTFVTEPFVGAARAAARGHGLPDLPLVAIPHDYLFETEDAMRLRARGLIEPLLAAIFADASA